MEEGLEIISKRQWEAKRTPTPSPGAEFLGI